MAKIYGILEYVCTSERTSFGGIHAFYGHFAGQCYVVGDETLSNNLTPFNYITLCIEDIYYRTTMQILVRLLY